MNDQDPNSPDSDSSYPTVLAPQRPWLNRLMLKEIRETIRDRRTIVTLILMPLLVYPTLSLVFKTFLLANASTLVAGKPVVFDIGFDGPGDEKAVSNMMRRIISEVEIAKKYFEERKLNSPDDPSDDSRGRDDSPATNLIPGVDSLAKQRSEQQAAAPENGLTFAPFERHNWLVPTNPDSAQSLSDQAEDPPSLREMVELKTVDVAIELKTVQPQQWSLGDLEIISRDDERSRTAARYLELRFEQFNQFVLRKRLQNIGVPTTDAIKVSRSLVGQQDEGPQQVPIASLVPLILVLLTITGAVYPAIDLTAGERERKTLETLMAAPISRMGILWSKFVAVLSVAIMTAVLNLIGMFATVWAFQLDKQFGGGLFNIVVMFKILLLLILFASFFSALLLAVTSFARSFKEAQVYLIPIILLSLGPGLVAMSPGMTLDGVNAAIPMVNILLLARDVILDQVTLVPACVVVVFTVVYGYLAIRMAAAIFGSDAILHVGEGSVAEMFRRPTKRHAIVPLVATVLCLVLLLPFNFAAIGFLGRMPVETASDLTVRFLMMSVLTGISFLILPWLVAKHQNTDITTGFGLLAPKPIFVVAALLLGISLWPIMMSMTEAWHSIYGILFGSEAQTAWEEKLLETTSEHVSRIRTVSPFVIAISFSIIPAVCEEWFFRGMLQRSLLKTKIAWQAIIISAVTFGAFHMLSNSVIAVDRFVPTTLTGLVLGYLAYKSNSIWPGVLLHAASNACVVFLGYYQPRLAELPWFPGEEESIPWSWVAISCGVVAIGIGVVFAARRTVAEPTADDANAKSDTHVAVDAV